MSDEARSAVASFLSVHKGQEKGISRLTTSAASKDHPFLDAAYQCLEDVWTEVTSDISNVCKLLAQGTTVCRQAHAGWFISWWGVSVRNQHHSDTVPDRDAGPQKAYSMKCS